MAFIQKKTPIPGPESLKMLARRAAALPNGLPKATQVVVKKAKGALVEDVDGNTLLDFAGGIGVLNAGHRPESVVRAIKKQADEFLHSCSLVTTYEPYLELAERLNECTPGRWPKKTLLANSGAETVENAVNLARFFTKRTGIVVFEGAYHGRTLLTVSMTSKYGFYKKGFWGFAPEIYRFAVPNFYRAPTGMNAADFERFYLQQLDQALVSQIDPSAIAAVVVEPVQGEGGMVVMPRPFLKRLRDLCDQHGILLIFDEIQCGMGRTGRLFASEHFEIEADLYCIAKSLGSGLPIGALVGRADVLDAPPAGGVGGTFGGSPLACAAAIESLQILSEPSFLKKATALGEQMRRTLESWKRRFPLVGDVRGLGPMRGIEFVKNRKTKEPDPDLVLEIIREATAEGLILIRAGLFSNCIRLLPPLVISKNQLAEGLEVLEKIIARAHEKRGIAFLEKTARLQLA